jgi:membrane-associated phospholipid phosphatase
MKPDRRKAVALWLSGAAAVAGSFFLDDAVIAFVKGHSNQSLQTFGRFGSYFGQWHWLMLPCAVVAVIAWKRRDAVCLRILCAMIITSIIAGLGVNALRVTTGRTRPSAPAEIKQGWYGMRHNGKWIVIKADYNAFPSGHAAASMGLVAPLLVMRRRIGWLLACVPLLIGAARICVGAHHLSDVVAGLLAGVAVAIWVTPKITPLLSRINVPANNVAASGNRQV